MIAQRPAQPCHHGQRQLALLIKPSKCTWAVHIPDAPHALCASPPCHRDSSTHATPSLQSSASSEGNSGQRIQSPPSATSHLVRSTSRNSWWICRALPKQPRLVSKVLDLTFSCTLLVILERSPHSLRNHVTTFIVALFGHTQPARPVRS